MSTLKPDMTELYLLRHAKSDWRSGKDDDMRPLNKRGKGACRKIGAWMAAHQVQPEIVVTSPAERALDTATRVIQQAGQDPCLLHLDHRVYHATARELIVLLRELAPRYSKIMLVGHNPGLEDLLLHLAPDAEPAENGKLLPAGALCLLGPRCDWHALRAGCAEVRALVRPRDLGPP